MYLLYPPLVDHDPIYRIFVFCLCAVSTKLECVTLVRFSDIFQQRSSLHKKNEPTQAEVNALFSSRNLFLTSNMVYVWIASVKIKVKRNYI